MAADFQFDPDSHLYRVAGQLVPSVTGALKLAGIAPELWMIPPRILNAKRQLGRVLHQCLKLLNEDDLDFSSVSPVLRPRLNAYLEWLKDSAFKPERIENPICGESGNIVFGGTPDVTGMLGGQPSLIDFKTTDGKSFASWGPQLAGYAILLPRPLIPPFKFRRYTLQLRSTGAYRLTEWKDESDFDVFRWALAIARWKLDHGLAAWGDQ